MILRTALALLRAREERTDTLRTDTLRTLGEDPREPYARALAHALAQGEGMTFDESVFSLSVSPL